MLGQADQAVAVFQQGMPTDVLTNLAIAYKLNGEFKQAEVLLNGALALSPNDAYVHYNLANLYSATNQLANAREHYQRALALDPKLNHAVYNLALLEVQANQPKQAKRWFARYLELSPNATNRTEIQQVMTQLSG
jgi:Tfp pilus assembly protein PilF